MTTGDTYLQSTESVQGLVYRINGGAEGGGGTGPELLREVLEDKGWIEYDRKIHGEHGWNVWWRTSTFRPSDYERLLPWQRLNHHANTTLLTRKDSLARSLHRMRAVFGGGVYNFCPLTFNLPGDYARLVTEYSYARRDLSKTNLWICKPADMSRGRGIFVFSDIADLQYHRKAVVQQYIARPLLIGGYKFDLRLYAVCPSLQPLTIYIYQEGLARFATERYDLSSLDNHYSHLTNTSINRHSPTYAVDKAYVGVGCKWTLTQLRHYFYHNDIDDRRLWSDIIGIVILTLVMQAMQASEIPAATSASSCFELYGFDVLIDENLKPWLLEVNYSPSLAADCQRDVDVKKPLLNDILDLANLSESDKQAALGHFSDECEGRRYHSGSRSSSSPSRMARSRASSALMGFGMRPLTAAQTRLQRVNSYAAVTRSRSKQRQTMPAAGEEGGDEDSVATTKVLSSNRCNRILSATVFTNSKQTATISTVHDKSTADVSQPLTRTPLSESRLQPSPPCSNSSNSTVSRHRAIKREMNIVENRENIALTTLPRAQTSRLRVSSSATNEVHSYSLGLQSVDKELLPRPPSAQRSVHRPTTSIARPRTGRRGRDTEAVVANLKERVGDLMLVFPFNEATRESHASGSVDVQRIIRELPAIHHTRQQWHAASDRRLLPAIARLWFPPRPYYAN